MSKIGKQELVIPAGVTVSVNGDNVTVKGKLGEISRNFDASKVDISVSENNVNVSPKNKDKKSQALWGTWAAHIKGMLKGVETPFTKKLIVEGVGYKWEVKGTDVNLSLGYSHPVVVKIPDGLTIKADKNTMEISGINKEVVGSFAKYIRSLREPEPYKGKGIRYDTEVIRRKQGKRSA